MYIFIHIDTLTNFFWRLLLACVGVAKKRLNICVMYIQCCSYMYTYRGVTIYMHTIPTLCLIDYWWFKAMSATIAIFMAKS